jgi:dTDP-4-amino-4,6-dideoxygalactose transaminase
MEETMNGKEEMRQELAAALAAFAGMQQEHAAMLAENRLKNLPDCVAKRHEAQQRLRRCLDRFDPALMAADKQFAGQVRNGISELMRREKALAAQVGEQRETIREKLRNLRKGKTRLKGYSLHGTAGPGPKYLSNRT